MGVFVLLVVGIKSTLTEIDEAAGLVALYTLCIECFVYKDLSIKKDLVRIAKSSMALAGAVILILAMANALTNYVVDQHLPDRVLEWMLKLGLDKTWQFLIVMNLFLLVLGMIMDGFSAILVAVPLVLPFAAHFGLGPFHVAIMFVLNLELAFSCPPLGLNLFISSFRFNRPVVSLYRIAMPFVGLLARGAARHHVRAEHLELPRPRRHPGVARSRGEGEPHAARGVEARVRAGGSVEPAAVLRRGQEEVPQRADAGASDRRLRRRSMRGRARRPRTTISRRSSRARKPARQAPKPRRQATRRRRARGAHQGRRRKDAGAGGASDGGATTSPHRSRGRSRTTTCSR